MPHATHGAYICVLWLIEQTSFISVERGSRINRYTVFAL